MDTRRAYHCPGRKRFDLRAAAPLRCRWWARRAYHGIQGERITALGGKGSTCAQQSPLRCR